MRVEVYFLGEEKNIPSCVSCKQGILKKMQLDTLLRKSWLAFYSPLWPGRHFTGCAANWEDSGPQISLVLHSSPLSLRGEQPHFVQPLLPLIWNDVALLCIRGLFWASSKPSCKVQDHYGRQKCSEIAHHCQLITKNPLIADIIINYIPIMTGTIGLSVFLALHWNPTQCRLVGENDLGALGSKLRVYMGYLCWPQQPVGLWGHPVPEWGWGCCLTRPQNEPCLHSYLLSLLLWLQVPSP